MARFIRTIEYVGDVKQIEAMLNVRVTNMVFANVRVTELMITPDAENTEVVEFKPDARHNINKPEDVSKFIERHGG